ncbi:MAG: hypothetical protein PVG20_04310 [Thioalkalispiraceae bacterium]|jgi:hypothetical protein
MSKKDKAALSKDAKQQVKKRTEELLDDDDFGTDIDFDDESLLLKPVDDGQIHISARRKLEDYLEEKRLRRAIEDDFDF